MITKPLYFERIRQRAAQRWDQLEADPDLAGPWHQLFKQVQSPRHVLSELLQNADDAAATEATVEIADGVFVFSHNGEDFIEEHFASLCRFGYSNKRALHTIGFRGIGFKSTFSLGDTVQLLTPTLAVAFNKQRFTEPVWTPSSACRNGHTEVRVPIADALRERELEKNLQEWLRSPVSLLFFRHIRRLRIQGALVEWRSMGAGPVANSEWMALNGLQDQPYLIARSEQEPFPEDALAEIKQERMLTAEEDRDFPPCSVEMVLGATGRLYVVLPTGVETKLPFACNAPFIQDPARLKIKDPETSPTNRWLLERAGELAASVMLDWLEAEALDVSERARAYALLPDIDREDNSLEGTCAATVELAVDSVLQGEPYVLTEGGELVLAGQCVCLPEPILDVWSPNQAAALLDEKGRRALCRHVSAADRDKLQNWRAVEEITKSRLLSVLQTKHLPKPRTWRGLLALWSYIAAEMTGYQLHRRQGTVRILPVQGKDVLYAANDIVRLGEKKLLQADADWDFLASYLLVLNHNWPRFLAEQRRTAEQTSAPALKNQVDSAYTILEKVGLPDASDASKVIEGVAANFFRQPNRSLADCVRLAQIAAKLGARIGSSFRFASRSRNLCPTSHGMLFYQDGITDHLLPEAWCGAHVLHGDYSKAFTSCTREEWLRWVSSGRAGLHGFAPLSQQRETVWGRWEIEKQARQRGADGNLGYPYVTARFGWDDWDFAEVLWRHWESLAAKDPQIWRQVVEAVLAQPITFWSNALTASAFQVATTGRARTISSPLLAGWIMKLREKPCLRDTRGFVHKPAELLRRTPLTEALLDVEPFVHRELDTESNRPLLDALGVQSTPTGPDRILECLRALSQAPQAPVHEVEKWYRRLDQLTEGMSTQDLRALQQAFHGEKLIFTDDGVWASATTVYLTSDEDDVPGAAVIRSEVRELSLWRKLQVAERPTADLAIGWLKSLASGASLDQDDLRRVKALTARHAFRVWEETRHWLNLAGEWVPVGALKYALPMQSPISWSHFHLWVKRQTADLRIPAHITEASPFSQLPHLATRIENRLEQRSGSASTSERRAWLNHLGAELQRVRLSDEGDTARVRQLADDLAVTEWQFAAELEVIPYLDGTPAGTPKRTEALWRERILYAERRPMARLARAVAQELGSAFGRAEIVDAIKICFERPVEFITEYLEENFTLLTREPCDPAVADGDGEHPRSDCDSAGGAPAGELGKVANTAEQEAAQEWGENEDDGGIEEHEWDLEEGDGDTDEEDERASRPRRSPRQRPAPKPSIMERFAKSQGFRPDGGNRFYHADGSWIARGDSAFPWEWRSAIGELVQYYWPQDHCLELEPLQLEAEIWGLVHEHPDNYALVLADPAGDAVAVSGAKLRRMVEAGSLILYPASYRLVHRNGN